MKKHFKKIGSFLEKIVKFFNFSFFLIAILIWIYLTITHLLSEPFQFSLFWAAFNDMYGQLSFKIGCIVLIIGNGIHTIQGFIINYYQIKEYHGHVSTIGKLFKAKN